MLARATDLLKFRIERFLLRGTLYRLLFIAALIGLVSLVGGLAIVEAGVGEDAWTESIWWAFLRLTDPGYLGDDQGVARRSVSTVLTVLGYVLFMGALVAILTTWLHQTIDRLESGLTPIAESDHVLVVGFSSRTATIFREIIGSERRVRRFLESHGARRLSIVLLAEGVSQQLHHDLRDRLGKMWRERSITLRSGTPLRIGHLRRVDFSHAAAIIVAGNPRQRGGATAADAGTIKTLLSMSTYGKELADDLPYVVAEVFDSRKARIAVQAYEGDIEVLSSDQLIGSLLAQNIRHPGLSGIYQDILTVAEGCALFVREGEDFVGQPFGTLRTMFPKAIAVGVVRPEGRSFRARLALPHAEPIRAGDRIVLMSTRVDRTSTRGGRLAEPLESAPRGHLSSPPAASHRIVMLGFNHTVPSILHALEHSRWDRVEVDILSPDSIAAREDLMRGREILSRVTVRHHVGDPTLPADLDAVGLATSRSVLIMSTDTAPTAAEADAQTLATYLLLRDLISELDVSPRVVVELVEASSARLFARERAEVTVTPLVVGRILAQVTLRRELRAVYDELLGADGAEFAFHAPELYDIPRGPEQTFEAMASEVARRGDILVGLYSRDGVEKRRTVLNPAHDSVWSLGPREQLIVISRTGSGRS